MSADIFATFQAALIRGFCALAEFRDPETGAHLDRLSAYAQTLATGLAAGSPYAGACIPEFVKRLGAAVPLHDIGKVGIPDRILLKPGPLTPGERAIMQTHATAGYQLLHGVSRALPAGVDHTLDLAAEIAASHHERWDGKGYPRGLHREQIPLAARIVAVADVYDACSTPRCYRPQAMAPDAVRDLILSGSGSQFDPVVVAAFQAVEPEFRRLREELADPPLAAAPAADPATEAGTHVLIVDDEPQVRRILRVALTQAGHHCDEAGSTMEARRLLDRQQYDLVTLDIRMPEEQGIVLLDELAPLAPQVAVVMVTGEGELDTAVSAMRTGAYDYLTKPFHIAQLRAAVSRVLERQRLEQELLAYHTRLENMVSSRNQEPKANWRARTAGDR